MPFGMKTLGDHQIGLSTNNLHRTLFAPSQSPTVIPTLIHGSGRLSSAIAGGRSPSAMEPTPTRKRWSSSQRLAAICLTILAIVSPLYIDRMSEDDPELEEEEAVDWTLWLHLLLLLLIMAIVLSLHLEQSWAGFDPYWIHRVGGSSGGILLILILLALVLKCKASL